MSKRYWLIDYDLPSEPKGKVVRFYQLRKKAIASAIQNERAAILYSSKSVIVTNSPSLAVRINELAKRFDAPASHVYCIRDIQLLSSHVNPRKPEPDITQSTLDIVLPQNS